LINLLAQKNITNLPCPVCQTAIPLTDTDYSPLSARLGMIAKMDKSADDNREIETTASIIQGKRQTEDFDVFLCYNSEDKFVIKDLGNRLKEKGILPWLDEWELRPGLPWQPLLENQIEKIKTAAVFVGKTGIGPWQRQELMAFLNEFVQRGCPVIPVVLSDAPQKPDLPPFLRNMTWVDFRVSEPEPFNRLVWGITGKREDL
jgi:hypothetical protein